MAAGWHIDAVHRDKYGAAFTATRGGLVLRVETEAVRSDEPDSTIVDIKRATPSLVPILTAVGLILGALLGFAAASALTRRVADCPPPRRAVVRMCFGLAAFTLTIPTCINLYFTAVSLIIPADRVAIWLGYTFSPLTILTLVGAGALAVGLLVCVPAPMAARLASLGTLAR